MLEFILTLILIAIVVSIHALGSFILTHITLWLSSGLFNYPLDDKFRYVFVIWFVIIPIINGIFSNSKN